MAFDGFIAKAVVKELNKELLNSRVDKINQPDMYSIYLSLYSNSQKYILELCIHPENCRFHLTKHPKPNPLASLNFCMLLRKHLLGLRIDSIDMDDLERVIYIHFSNKNEYSENVSKTLVLEIMGRYSNIILCDNQNNIIDVMKHTYSTRNLFPKNVYAPPISSKVSIYDINSFEEFYNVLVSYDLSLTKAFIGFSKSYSLFLVQKLNTDFSNIESIRLLYEYLQEIKEFNMFKCCNTGNGDYVLDISQSSINLNVNYFLDNYYFNKENNELFVSFRNYLLKIILSVLKKYEKRLENINIKLKETESMDIYKLYGELIISNLYRFNHNLSSITVENFYDNNELITIPLNVAFSPHKNADIYFKKYTKLKNTVLIVSKQKEDTEQELYYIESIIFALENSQTYDDLNDIYLEISRSSLFKEFFKPNEKNIKIKESANSPKKYIIDGYTVLVRQK